MSVRIFGEVDGQTIHEIVLKNASGATASVITWGAVLRDLVVPSAHGPQRVVVGLETLEDYRSYSSHAGAIAGRFANRIRHGTFTLEDKTYQLLLNEANTNSLHGGGKGFGKRPWQLAWHSEDAVALTLFSPDGDANFPGNMTVTCIYRLLEPGTIRVEMTATTDAPTVINLAHHSYFNLDGSPDVLDHHVQIHADFYTPSYPDTIPTGEIYAVKDTVFDFNRMRPFRDRTAADPQLYDHNFVLRGPRGVLQPVASVRSPKNGLQMDVLTTEPAIQFYDGAKFKVPVPGLGGAQYGAHAGLCLETQYFPNSPNHRHFTDSTLMPDDVYRHTVEYCFA